LTAMAFGMGIGMAALSSLGPWLAELIGVNEGSAVIGGLGVGSAIGGGIGLLPGRWGQAHPLPKEQVRWWLGKVGLTSGFLLAMAVGREVGRRLGGPLGGLVGHAAILVGVPVPIHWIATKPPRQ
jgi:hypothetical protein